MFVSGHNLGIRYGDRWVFRATEFEWSAASLVAILGPSGSGKTTLLSIVSGSVRPTEGYCVVEATDAPRYSAGWVVQNSPLLVNRSALDNVLLGPLFSRVSDSQARFRALSSLSRLGLEELAHAKAGRLSGGERQRVTVARALASGSPLVLADEPTSSLNPELKLVVAAALRDAAMAGALVIMATHDRDVAAYADVVHHLGSAPAQ